MPPVISIETIRRLLPEHEALAKKIDELHERDGHLTGEEIAHFEELAGISLLNALSNAAFAETEITDPSRLFVALTHPQYRPHEMSIPLSLTEGMGEAEIEAFKQIDEILGGPRFKWYQQGERGKLRLDLQHEQKRTAVYNTLRSLPPDARRWVLENHISEQDFNLLREHHIEAESP